MKSMKYGKIMLVLRNEKRYELNITPQKHRIYGENERKTTEEQEQKKMDEQGWEPENGNLNEETSLQPWERFKKKKKCKKKTSHVGVSVPFEVWLRSTYKAIQLGFSEGLIINGNTSGSAN